MSTAWVIASCIWLVPAVVMLVMVRLMSDEPGGPDWWMPFLWPVALVVISWSALRERWRARGARARR